MNPNHNARDGEALAVHSDNRFAIIPHWVIFSGITSGALHLYAVLTKYADNATGQAWPSRTTLAKDIGKSIRTVDGYLKELVGIGAVVVQQRKKSGTEQNFTNLYTVITARPREVAATVRLDPVQHTAPPPATDCAENYTHLSTPSSSVAADLPISAQALPRVCETRADNDVDAQLGISSLEKSKLIDVAVFLHDEGIAYYDDEHWDDYADLIEEVLPTQVGMIPRRKVLRNRGPSAPHAGGDDPRLLGGSHR